ncbi:sulfatase-like hydrolase/transferase [Pseudoalteromonas sp. MMG012]|uniref:sulfatase-like hydrolase/transferase n=1 Tax=Pseudoalteromonas sp. MMG012 TaxID=2822686 RepID=UPI001B3A2130|nr:sulfatase-like hydrolase/transferase [Pseudoalteromonas sp. MMG012]MBQ4852935.1 sulfatase-like hydrolase/transferase [Pseudoalteromonas sp. MMG012]
MTLKKHISSILLLFIPFLALSFMVYLSYDDAVLKPTSYVRIAISSVISIYFYHLILFLIKSRILRCISVVTLSFFYTLLFSSYVKYGSFSVGMIASIWETNINESFEFFNSHSFVVEMMFFIIISSPFIIIIFKIEDFLDNKRIYLCSSVIVIIVSLISFVRYLYAPAYEIKGFERFAEIFGGIPKMLSLAVQTKELLDSESIPITSKWNLIEGADDSYNYVIIVGESVQQKRFSESINKIDSEKVNGWKIYTNAIAPATQTRYSVPRLLSLNNIDNLYYGLNIIDLAKESGLKTHWYSNQARVGEDDTPVTRIAMRADQYNFHNLDYSLTKNDFVLIDDLSQGLEQQPNGNLFILHMIGSHFDFCYRVGLLRATPDLQSKCYDKTILELVSFINKVKETVSHDKYKIIYVSDHGLTSIDEPPFLTHGVGKQFSTDAVNTPLIFIESATERHSVEYDNKEYFLRDLPHTLGAWLNVSAKELNSDAEIDSVVNQDRFVIDSGDIRFLQ